MAGEGPDQVRAGEEGERLLGVDENFYQLFRKAQSSRVARALDEVGRADLRRRLAQRVRSGKGIDRGDEVLEASRRWQR